MGVALGGNMQSTMVVALFLSLISVCSGIPMGYEYPVPEVPFIEGPPMSTTSPPEVDMPDCVPQELDQNPYYMNLLDLGTPICPQDELYYDDYNPNDIPEDQAAPSNEGKGYEYPVPENPLTFPSKPTTTPLPLPECILYEEQNEGLNPSYLDAGVPLCPDYDEYDPNDIPTDQAMPLPDCVESDQKDSPMNKEYIKAGVPLCPSDEPAGYEYPAPTNPLTLPPKTTTPAPEIYDDYDPNDIPDDQAEVKGYEYPVPEIPFTLPPKITTPRTTGAPVPQPECIPEDKQSEGPNPQFLDAGVPLCPSEDLPGYQPSPPEYDDYDINDIPADQAEPVPDCIFTEDQNTGSNPKFIADGVPICPSDELEGYEYPVPENPLILPTKPATTELPLLDCVDNSEKNNGANPGFIAAGVPLCPSDGYSYPAPSNPLQLPERSRKAKLVLEEDPDFLLIGLTHNEDDSYDPEYYDHNSEDYIDSMDGDFSENEIEMSNSVTESGVSLTGIGKVFSFHVPSSFNVPPNKPKSKNMHTSNAIFDGSRLQSTLKAGSRGDKSEVRGGGLSRMPKMVKDHNEDKVAPKLQTTVNKRMGKSLGSKSKKRNSLSVQAWLRRG